MQRVLFWALCSIVVLLGACTTQSSVRFASGVQVDFAERNGWGIDQAVAAVSKCREGELGEEECKLETKPAIVAQRNIPGVLAENAIPAFLFGGLSSLWHQPDRGSEINNNVGGANVSGVNASATSAGGQGGAGGNANFAPGSVQGGTASANNGGMFFSASNSQQQRQKQGQGSSNTNNNTNSESSTFFPASGGKKSHPSYMQDGHRWDWVPGHYVDP